MSSTLERVATLVVDLAKASLPPAMVCGSPFGPGAFRPWEYTVGTHAHCIVLGNSVDAATGLPAVVRLVWRALCPRPHRPWTLTQIELLLNKPSPATRTRALYALLLWVLFTPSAAGGVRAMRDGVAQAIIHALNEEGEEEGAPHCENIRAILLAPGTEAHFSRPEIARSHDGDHFAWLAAGARVLLDLLQRRTRTAVLTLGGDGVMHARPLYEDLRYGHLSAQARVLDNVCY